MDYISCSFEPAQYLFLSPEVEPLIYYSHFVAIASALLISSLVFLHNPKLWISRLFLGFAVIFSVWAFVDVLLWATNDPGIVMFGWSMQVLAEPILYTIAFYLFYLNVNGKIPSHRLNYFIGLILLPLIVFLPTTLTLGAVELSYCESEEGPIALYYTYFLNITFILLVIYTGLRNIPKLRSGSNQRKSIIFFILGLVTFLLSFSGANIYSSFTDNWTISQYGLFGMPIFAGLVAYSIVQFNAFRIQVAGAQILVVTLLALVASLLVIKPEMRIPITSATLLFTSLAGFFLIRSVKREFEQRTEIERLVITLDNANARLKELDKMKSEFVSIASHQLRSPLTSIRGYASMLLEGSYGTIPDKAREALERIADSSKHMVSSVEDYLNVSRIESGNMKYELSDFNFKKEVEHVVDEVRATATQKGLLLTFRSDISSQGIVNADIGKTRQALHNLINNSIKYTDKGSIVVTVGEHQEQKQIWAAISDTGVGMSEETKAALFAKFSRAKDANKTNSSGTGLGLFVARKMIQAMNGDITATSEGEGRGSVFTLTLPLQQ